MNFLQFLWTLKTVSSLHYESDFQPDKAAPTKKSNRTDTDIEWLELENLKVKQQSERIMNVDDS